MAFSEVNMASSVQSDNTRYYEEQAAHSLVAHLKALAGLQVFPLKGGEGYARKFNRKNVPVWPTSFPPEAEVDFFCHCLPSASTPVLKNSTVDGHVFFTTSFNDAPPSRPTSPTRPNSRFSDATTETSDIDKVGGPIISGTGSLPYVVAEMLYGGRHSLIPKKPQQLEKAARLAYIKTFHVDVTFPVVKSKLLAAVQLALIVSQDEKCNEVFSHIYNNQDLYPLLSVLMAHGRLVYVQNTLVPTKLIGMLKDETITLREDLDAQRAVVSSQEETIGELSERLETVSSVAASQKETIDKLQAVATSQEETIQQLREDYKRMDELLQRLAKRGRDDDAR